ncbi:MAG: virulence-associated protein E [Porphyrobacter sp. IPPAS B-1204]|nr:MAG: virulence-associated protein E [Porphyrobacter sp. IPPAS B-1204]
MPITAKPPSQRLIDLVGALGGNWSGYSAMCRCPAHMDETPSLSLRQGDSDILVHCFAGCDPADVLRELRAIVPGMPYTFRGGPGRSFNSTAIACNLWAQGQSIAGTWGEAYCDYRDITGRYDDLRFHPRCPKGKAPTALFLPAVLVGVREGNNIKAVQRIFLRPGGEGYAAKLMIGNPQAGSWQGRRPGKTLAIAEGFESAARFADLHDVPTWSSLGAARLGLCLLPDEIEELLIAEDNDGEGRRASIKAREAYARDGLTIRCMPPPSSYMDWAAVPAPS